MSELEPVNPKDWYEFSAIGARAKHEVIPIETWTFITTGWIDAVKSSRWIIADLLNDGEQRYGDKYAQAIEITGLSYQTLAQWCSVGKAIPYEQRDPDVPWSYYRRIKALPNGERQQFIDQAASGHLSTGDELKEAIDRHKRPPDLTNTLCPCCLSQLDEYALEKGKCQECKSRAPEWARRFGELLAAAQALRTFGEVEPFQTFCTRYNTLEDKNE